MTEEEVKAYRKQMLAHVLNLAKLGKENAIEAADWYEKNEPWHLHGLGDRVRKDLSAKGKE